MLDAFKATALINLAQFVGALAVWISKRSMRALDFASILCGTATALSNRALWHAERAHQERIRKAAR